MHNGGKPIGIAFDELGECQLLHGLTTEYGWQVDDRVPPLISANCEWTGLFWWATCDCR